MENFLDTFLDVKLDECSLTIRELDNAIDEMCEREKYIRKGSDAHRSLRLEFINTVYRKQRVILSKERLMIKYVSRQLFLYSKGNY